MKRTRKTKQLVELEKTIESMHSFFTAEELHAKAKHIGMATIYRLLKTLENTHSLHSYSCNRKKIYATSKESHCHFTCQVCKKTQHIHIEKLDFLKKNLGDICHFQIDITGVCKECRKKP